MLLALLGITGVQFGNPNDPDAVTAAQYSTRGRLRKMECRMTHKTSLFARPLLPAALSVTLVACNSATGPGTALTVNFKLADGATAVAAMDVAGYGVTTSNQALQLTVTGSNGTLTLNDIRVIVDEFKLERENGACEDGTAEDSCERFEAPPHFLTVPLDGVEAGTVTEDVPAGTYLALKFETKAPDGSEVGTTLLGEVRQEFADWPQSGSAVVVGSFAPADGSAPVAFRVYLDAEVKVELEFAQPLVIAEDASNQSVTVSIDPAAWFENADGTVVDLSALDFDATGEVVDFEFKFADGFTKIELDG